MVKRKSRINRINRIDSDIFGSLYKANRPIPIGQLARRINVSWKTAKLHALKLQKLKILKIKRSIRRNYASLNQDYIKQLKKKGLI